MHKQKQQKCCFVLLDKDLAEIGRPPSRSVQAATLLLDIRKQDVALIS